MELKKALHMNGGDGETSYANNSRLQKIGISKSLSVLDDALRSMCNVIFPKCFNIADFGCASGPNTILVISHIMDTIEQLCKKNNSFSLPEFQVFLNDLPENDFNSLFKLLPNAKEKRRCFAYGVPGSFYGRIFPGNSLHFAYSSYSLIWLSQVPEGIQNNNKENIYLAMGSAPEIFEAYARQFHRDFSTFLRSRGEEMITGGHMVLTFVGRSVEDPSCKDDCAHFTILGKMLLDMADEGLIQEADLHLFNLPIYTPSMQELEAIIESEGSFNLVKLEKFQVPWDANSHTDGDHETLLANSYRSGILLANFVRAFMEPVLASHFGSSIDFDGLFERYSKKVGEHIFNEKPSFFNMVISLSKI